MNKGILFICKASINDGLGHLIRTLTVADHFHEHHSNIPLSLILVSQLNLSYELSKRSYNIEQVANDGEISIHGHYQRIVLDSLGIDTELIQKLKKQTNKLISISPIFNQMNLCDMLITRTRYTTDNYSTSLTIKGGLQYSIIRSDCERITSEKYTHNLNRPSCNIAISMGGTDPSNMTLQYLKALTQLDEDLVFWVLLGEGYEHNYKELADMIKSSSKHEIILARTNRNMWQILSNCSLAVLKGGLTSYEAVYAGLPAINVFNDENRAFLVKELEEHKLCLPTSYSNAQTLEILNSYVNDKKSLNRIHQNTKAFFKTPPVFNVAKAILQ